MSFVVATLRRSLWLLLIGAVGGVAWSWWSDRNAPPSPTTPPEWPPLDGQAADASDPTTVPATAQPTPDDSSTASSTSNESAASTESQPASNGASSPSVVNALIDAPEARSSSDAGGWVAPADDGSCPVSHPVKANDNSGIFHVPDGRFYDRTNPERCYTTPDTATADGYRQAKN